IPHRLLVHKQSFLLVVLDLSKVANPYIRLRDKDLLKSKDPQVVSEPFGRTLNKKNLFYTQEIFSDPMESLSPQVILNGNSSTPTRVVDGVVQGVKGTWGNPHQALKDKRVIESGCSIHMTGNIFISLTLKKSTEDMLHLLEIQKFYRMKGIKREFSVARTPQQNRVAERKNRTLIEAGRTMLADSLLPIPFWAEVINTACYVQNRVLVTKPHNKTPYDLLLGRTTSIGLMRPFGCPVTILNPLDPLRKFDGNANKGFLVGYSVSNKAFRVFNSRTIIVQETLHTNFLKNQPNVAGSGPTWLFDIDTLTQSMNYQLVAAGNQPNSSTSIQGNFDASKVGKDTVFTQQYVLLPLLSTKLKDPQNTNADAAFDDQENESAVYVSPSSSGKTKKHDEKVKREDKGKSPVEFTPVTAVGPNSTNSTNSFNAAGPSNTAVSPTFEIGGKSSFVDPSQYLDDPNMPALEDITYSDDEEDVGAEANFSNLETSITISPIPTTRVHKDHPTTQIIGDLSSAPQTRSMTRMVKDQVARIEAIRLFLAYASFMGCMVYQMDVKSAFLYETIEEEVYVCQPLGFEDPDYPDKVYEVVKSLYGLHQAPKDWYEILANYLLKNGFQSGKIDQTLFIKKQKGDILLVQVYVDDIIFGSTNKNLCKAFEKLMKDKFQMSSMGELTFFLGLQVKKKVDGIFISQDKYVAKILKKFGLTDRKLLLKDPGGKDVDTIVATSSTEAEYVAAASCCAQVLWIQNQLLDYGHFLNVVSSKLMLFGLTIDAAHLMLLVDVAGVDCLPTKEIFAELARMGYEKPSTKLTFYKAFFSAQWKFLIHIILQCMSAKRTAWNEFSSSMASAIICLPTGRKFNFSKYISDNMVRNVDSPLKFLMYPRFLQLMINTQVNDLSSHNTKYTSPALIQKVFAKMRRIGKGFSRVHTPLFDGMLLQQQARAVEDAAEDENDDNEVSTEPTLPSPTPRLQSSSKRSGGGCIQTGRKIAELDVDEDVTLEDVDADVAMDAEVAMDADVQGRLAESQAKVYHLDLQHAEKVLSMQDTDEAKPAKVEEVIEVVTAAKLMTKVVTTAATTITAAQVPKASALRRKRGVVMQDPKETAIALVIVHFEVKSKDKGKAELNANINWDDVMEQVKTREKQDNIIMRYQALKRKPITKAQARKNMMIYLKNMARFKMDFFKGMTYNDIRPIFEKHYNSIKAFLEKGKKEIMKEGNKRKDASLNQGATKK
nr:putative ribonuclease H-like domain-containing protein [Tanacetum cinerariifolium]GEY10767.1 putative ribonuclease H-like domain-containing protein [Tanacetum cinerariifolium]